MTGDDGTGTEVDGTRSGRTLCRGRGGRDRRRGRCGAGVAGAGGRAGHREGGGDGAVARGRRRAGRGRRTGVGPGDRAAEPASGRGPPALGAGDRSGRRAGLGRRVGTGRAGRWRRERGLPQPGCPSSPARPGSESSWAPRSAPRRRPCCRRHVRHPWRWIGANAAAWTPAMALIFIGAGLPGAGWPVLAVLSPAR